MDFEQVNGDWDKAFYIHYEFDKVIPHNVSAN